MPIRKALQKPSKKDGILLKAIGNAKLPAGRTQFSHPLLSLQHTIGNYAVGQMIQAKLKVGRPGDQYEHEADHMADAVMRMPEPFVQRRPQEEEDRMLRRQPKEEEDEMMRRQPVEEDEELQRTPMNEENEELQTKATGSSVPQVSPRTQSQIANLRGGGRPLSTTARAFYEPRFGYDFSEVRVHADSRAAETARAVNAKAFTVGRDVVFGPGEYAPESAVGRRLLGHELTHVVQQSKASHGAAGGSMPSVQRQVKPEEEESAWKSFSNNPIGNNPIWNAATNNTFSGASSLLEQASNLPALVPQRYVPGLFVPQLRNLFGMQRGTDMALGLGEKLAAPGQRLPGVFGMSDKLGGMSKVSAALAPLGVISNAMAIHEAVTRPGRFGLGNLGDVTSSSAGLFSSAVGTTGLAGTGLTALGATSAGGALTGAAAALGPAAAVAGAGAGGYALGTLLDKGVGWLGKKITGNEGGDYSLSGMGASAMTSIDQTAVSALRNIGALDKSRPEYTQTLGWWLSEHLPSWLQ